MCKSNKDLMQQFTADPQEAWSSGSKRGSSQNQIKNQWSDFLALACLGKTYYLLATIFY
jgi:hypothetical protein